MTESERDHYESWRFALACLRAEHRAGRKLTPQEMIAAVEMEQSTCTPNPPASSLGSSAGAR